MRQASAAPQSMYADERDDSDVSGGTARMSSIRYLMETTAATVQVLGGDRIRAGGESSAAGRTRE